MQKFDPSLFIREMRVYKSSSLVYQASFHQGVNIIRGENGSGKSTVMNLLFYSLGGEYTEWTNEAKSCSVVYVEIETFGAVLTLRRRIAITPQPIEFFWGPLSDGINAGLGWDQYSTRRSTNNESFSQVLFRAINFPEVKTEDENNITMHQVLRLLFIDQGSSYTSLMIDETFDSPLTRKVTADLLLGIYDNNLYNAQISRVKISKELSEFTSEHKGLMSVLKVSGNSTTVAELESQIRDIAEELIIINKSVAANVTQPLRIKSVDTSVSELSRSLAVARTALGTALRELENVVLDIQDSQEFIDSLRSRILALNESIETRRILGQLPITQCPHCLKTLARENSVEENCILCDQPLPLETKQTQAMRMRQELELQLNESNSLLTEKVEKVQMLENGIPSLRTKAKVLQKQYDSYVTNVQTSRDEQIDTLLVRKGGLEREQQFLQQQISVMRLLELARRKMDDAKKRISLLDETIRLKIEAQRRKSSTALNSISKFAVFLLKQDGNTEDAFAKAERVDVDFARNTFAVDGRNNHSGSSKVYAKNASLFGIFFASLENQFFRYPRLIMCDNIEDKGMQTERSQRFQRGVVTLSQKSNTEHQIIFSTSMIDKSLNNENYCIGGFYTPDNKTLNFTA